LEVNPKIYQGLEALLPDPLASGAHLSEITGACARSYSYWTILVDADAWKFGTKRNLYLVFSAPLPVQKTCRVTAAS